MDNNYSAFFQRGGFVSEPAILVKYNDDTSQVWSMEKLDLKLIDMRELYDELKSLDENAKALFSNLRKNSGEMFFYKGLFTNYVGKFWGFGIRSVEAFSNNILKKYSVPTFFPHCTRSIFKTKYRYHQFFLEELH